MKKQITTQQKQSEETVALSQTQPQGERVFETVEEVLRFDAAQNPVPPRVADRVAESVQREPAPSNRSWWGRLLGG